MTYARPLKVILTPITVYHTQTSPASRSKTKLMWRDHNTSVLSAGLDTHTLVLGISDPHLTVRKQQSTGELCDNRRRSAVSRLLSWFGHTPTICYIFIRYSDGVKGTISEVQSERFLFLSLSRLAVHVLAYSESGAAYRLGTSDGKSGLSVNCAALLWIAVTVSQRKAALDAVAGRIGAFEGLGSPP